MLWLEGLEKEFGRFVATVVDDAGSRTSVQVEMISKVVLPIRGAKRLRVDTSFADWGQATASEYLNGANLTFTIREDHQVFWFEQNSTRYLVPAFVLAKAMFRPFAVLSQYLWRPQGLQELCIPHSQLGSVHFFTSLLGTRAKAARSIQQPLSWMSCFPSANESWHSVYANACAGRLAFRLPHAQARIIVRGQSAGASFYVDDARIIYVRAMEDPYPFADGHDITAVFHDVRSTATRIGKPRPIADARLLKRGDAWSTSDQEWAQLMPLFDTMTAGNQRRRTHATRLMLDGILAKMGTGIAWQKASFETGTWSSAAWFYREWRRDGRWDTACDILARLRNQQ